MKKFLVVPTNRPASLARFLREWGDKGGWTHLVIVEDAPERSGAVSDALSEYFLDRPGACVKGDHYSHAEIATELGADAWVISKGSSACRSFGFLKAYREGADYVLTLDDDCLPQGGADGYGAWQTFFERHVNRLSLWPRWAPSVPGLNVRGLPKDGGGRDDVAMNLGLWSGCPDLGAAEQLASGRGGDFRPPPGNWLVPARAYVPVSGMNLCVARRAVPLAYFAPMGDGQPYHRFDDIWMGVVAKKVCDLLGWQVGVGEPFVRHERASDPHKNLALEAPGLEENERFWKRIDSLKLSRGLWPAACTRPEDQALSALTQVGDALRALADEWAWPYAYRYGQALGVWCRLLRAGPGPTAQSHHVHARGAV